MLVLVVVAFAAIAVQRNWEAVRADLGRLGPLDYVAAGAAATVAVVLLAGAWRTVLRGLGSDLSTRDAHTTYFAAQLGKYVPGSVWPALIQARLGRRNGVPARRMVASYVVWMVLLCSVGACAGLLLLASPEVDLPGPVVLGAALAGFATIGVAVHERGALRWVAVVAARAGRDVGDLRMAARQGWEATGWCALVWAAFGFHVWLLARPLGAGAADLPLFVGGFALAFVAGIAAVPLPAGAGVREAVFVVALAPALGRPTAITVALLSRLVVVVVEVALAAASGVPAAIRHVRSGRGDGPTPLSRSPRRGGPARPASAPDGPPTATGG